MGQQQLLLLVLASVIVGLATIAGVNAFREQEGRAAQQALIQRGTEIGTDILSIITRPTSSGGVPPTTTNGDVLLERAGYETGTGINTATDPRSCGSGPSYTTSAPGAGPCSECRLQADNQSQTVQGVTIEADQVGIWCRSPKAPNDVVVVVDPDPDAKDPVEAEFVGSTVGY